MRRRSRRRRVEASWLDIITAADECLLHASDGEQFVRATRLGRPIVTADHDFLRLACGHWETGMPFSGVILIQPATRIGDAVHAIALLATVLNSDDMSNWAEVVPDAGEHPVAGRESTGAAKQALIGWTVRSGRAPTGSSVGRTQPRVGIRSRRTYRLLQAYCLKGLVETKK